MGVEEEMNWIKIAIELYGLTRDFIESLDDVEQIKLEAAVAKAYKTGDTSAIESWLIDHGFVQTH